MKFLSFALLSLVLNYLIDVMVLAINYGPFSSLFPWVLAAINLLLIGLLFRSRRFAAAAGFSMPLVIYVAWSLWVMLRL